MSHDFAQISYSELLDHAANDDAVAFRNAAALDPSSVDRPALWYIRHPSSTTRPSLQTLTPLMVAAAYGSLSILSLILDELSLASPDRSFADRATALHYAASSGSPSAIPAVKILLSHYADTDAVDREGRLPADVIVVRPDREDDAPVLRRAAARRRAAAALGAAGFADVDVSFACSHDDGGGDADGGCSVHGRLGAWSFLFLLCMVMISVPFFLVFSFILI